MPLNATPSTNEPIPSRLRVGGEPIGCTSAALALLLAALWGGTPVAVSYSVDTLPPIAVAAVRFWLAVLFMLFWAALERSELRLRPGQLVPSVIAGILLFLQISLFHIGVDLSNSSHGTLLINSFVIWVAILGHFVTDDDPLSWKKAMGLILAALGVALILILTRQFETHYAASGEPVAAPMREINQKDLPTWRGDLILLASAFLLGVKIVYTKHALRRVEPSKLIFWHDVVGVLLFVVASASCETVRWSDFEAPAVWGLLYQGLVVAGFCFAMHTRLLKRHSASRLSVFAFTTPLFGILAAWLFRGDPMSPWLWASGTCVALGIIVVNRAEVSG